MTQNPTDDHPTQVSLEEIKSLYLFIAPAFEDFQEGIIRYEFRYNWGNIYGNLGGSTALIDITITIDTLDDTVTVKHHKIIPEGQDEEQCDTVDEVTLSIQEDSNDLPLIRISYDGDSPGTVYQEDDETSCFLMHSEHNYKQGSTAGVLSPQMTTGKLDNPKRLSTDKRVIAVGPSGGYDFFKDTWEVALQALHLLYVRRRPDFQHPVTNCYWLYYACYPSTEFLSKTALWNYETFRPVSFFTTHTDIKTWVKDCFGERALRKDFIKALVNCQKLTRVNAAHHLHDIMEPDWLIEFMNFPDMLWNEQPIVQDLYKSSRVSAENVTLLFTHLSPSQKRVLLLDTGGVNGGYIVYDILKLVSNFTECNLWEEAYSDEHWGTVNIRTWEDYHDWLAATYTKVNKDSYPIPQDSEYTLMDGASYEAGGDTYTLISPKSTGDLAAWGDELRNCIGGYDQTVLRGETHVYAVRKNNEEKLYAAVEYHEGEMGQYMEKFNTPAPAEIQAGFLQLMKELEAVHPAVPIYMGSNT